jgi:hypothetical protein
LRRCSALFLAGRKALPHLAQIESGYFVLEILMASELQVGEQ